MSSAWHRAICPRRRSTGSPPASRAGSSPRRRASHRHERKEPAMTELPGRAESCWVADAPTTRYPAFAQSDRTDVAIVGAGIVGLTSAYLLSKAGFAVTVLEGRRVARAVTARSTAKITCQHTLAYARLARAFGMEQARRYAHANRTGMSAVIDLAPALRLRVHL